MTEEATLARVHAEMKEVSKSYGPIRFLPSRESTYENYRDIGLVARDLASHHDRPVLVCTQVKRRSNVNVVPLIGTIFDQPKPSKHRSKRLWKKLRRMTARALYGQPMIISFNPERLKAILSAS